MPVVMKTKGGKSVNSMAGLLGVFQKDFGEDIGNFGGTLVNSDRLPTSIFPLDLALAGGLPHGKVSVIYGPSSSGKCHAAGTKILMFDGSLKNVEDIRTGDKAMGVDSTPRTVTGVGKGYGPLFAHFPGEGRRARLRRERRTRPVARLHAQSRIPPQGRYCEHFRQRLDGEVGQDWKIYHHLYRVGVEFPEKDLPLDPYWLGLWLGDGATRVSAITTTDAEIVDFLQEHADRNRWRLAVYLAEGRCPSYATVGDVRGTMRARPVVPLDWLQRLGLIQNSISRRSTRREAGNKDSGSSPVCSTAMAAKGQDRQYISRTRMNGSYRTWSSSRAPSAFTRPSRNG